jgi:ribosomal protein S27E
MTNYNELRDGQEFYGNGYKKGYEDAKKEFARPQGEWIDHSEDYGYVECPKCEHLTNCEGNVDELHYCWHCGAKLVKGKKAGVEE